MTVQNAAKQNVQSNLSHTTGSDWVVVDGNSYRKQADEQGEYIILGGTKKIYLADLYAQKSDEAKKAKIQNDILKFFTQQEEDFSDRSAHYESLVQAWTAKLIKNQSIYNLSKNVVEAKDDALDPLYVKYNTFDISKFSDNKDKKLGFKLWGERKSAKHDGNVAFSLAQFEKTVINEYKESASFSDFCSKQIAKMQLNCLKDIIMG